MSRKLLATVTVGALSFAVFLASGGTVAEQAAFLDGAGLAPNRNCTCPVRLSEEYASDAGLKLYQRLLFPCVITALADGGRDAQLPPMPQGVRAAIDVVDWTDCSVATSTAPVAALWGTARPFTSAGVVKPWCRAVLPGLPCLLADGRSFGDKNVSLCAWRLDPNTCERVPVGVVHAIGEEDL